LIQGKIKRDIRAPYHLLAAARRTPRIQNNSGLPQGPATGSVVG
jgi:hypothetical protein